MMRSLYSAVSGLKTHQTKMDVIGNNISNVNKTNEQSFILINFLPIFLSPKTNVIPLTLLNIYFVPNK